MRAEVEQVSDVGDAIDEIRAAYAEAMPDFMPDVCRVTVPGAPTASRGQSTSGASTETANVPCSYEGLSATERAIGGTSVGAATHVIELPVVWQGAYLNVTAESMIVVDARGVNPALTFSVTGALPTSTRLKQRVAATLNT